MYDSSRGAFTDLSVLDVLQIFGRAGRPGLETSGEGYICTTDDKLAHYLEAVTSAVGMLNSGKSSRLIIELRSQSNPDLIDGFGMIYFVKKRIRFLGEFAESYNRKLTPLKGPKFH